MTESVRIDSLRGFTRWQILLYSRYYYNNERRETAAATTDSEGNGHTDDDDVQLHVLGWRLTY